MMQDAAFSDYIQIIVYNDGQYRLLSDSRRAGFVLWRLQWGT